jgi:RNA polymerase sigma-70 factor, ECF subfamily
MATVVRPLAWQEPRPLEVETSDAELVRRAREGDTWALDMLYRRHVQLVAATALRLLRNRAEAEDVAHEAFLLAFERLDQLDEASAFRAWLVRIAVSRAHRRFRWRRLRSWVGLGSDEDACFELEAKEHVSAEQRTELALIDRALATLPFEVRTAWVLRHVLGHALDEVASACDCSLATVKRRITLAEDRVAAHVNGARHG